MSFEKLSWGIIIVAFPLKMNGVPGGSLLFLLSTFVCSLFYLIFSVPLFYKVKIGAMFRIESYEGLSARGLATSIVAGIIFSAILVGSLYSVQEWNGGTYILLLGLVFLAILLIVGFFANRDQSYPVYKAVLGRAVVLGVFGLLCQALTKL